MNVEQTARTTYWVLGSVWFTLFDVLLAVIIWKVWKVSDDLIAAIIYRIIDN